MGKTRSRGGGIDSSSGGPAPAGQRGVDVLRDPIAAACRSGSGGEGKGPGREEPRRRRSQGGGKGREGSEVAHAGRGRGEGPSGTTGVRWQTGPGPERLCRRQWGPGAATPGGMP